MTDTQSQAERKSRLRWITLGEAIAIAALVVSAVGVWISWEGTGEKGPTRIVEEKPSVPLTLRGRVRDGGRTLEIAPVEAGHALQSLNIIVGKSEAIDVGSAGELDAGDFENALGEAAQGKGTQRVRVRIDSRYVEAGADRSATGSYVITFRWEGGGLFGGRSVRFSGLSKG